MSIKFLVLGGGVFWVWGGGGSADSIFMGAGIFLTKGVEKASKTRKWTATCSQLPSDTKLLRK